MIGWVRVDAGVGDDPKIGQIAQLIGSDDAKAIGHLVLLWAKMVNQAKDGDLSTVPDEKLEKWADWHGRRGRLAVAVRSVLCDDRGVMRAWERHNGAPIRKADADLARKNAARYGTPRGEDVTASRADFAPTVTPTVAPTVAAPGAGTDETDETDVRQQRQQPARARLVGRLPDEPCRSAILAWLDALPEGQNPETWASIFAAWCDGLDLPPGTSVTPTTIATVCRHWGAIPKRDYVPIFFQRCLLRVLREGEPSLEQNGWRHTGQRTPSSAQERVEANRGAAGLFARGARK